MEKSLVAQIARAFDLIQELLVFISEIKYVSPR